MTGRHIYRWVAKALLFFLGGILLMELFFRFVIRADQRPVSIRTDQGIMLFDTSIARTGYTTIGRRPLTRFRWHINDQGWNSTVDYLSPDERERPLIAVVGDSHVENLQSDVGQSIASHLQRMVGDDYLVYGFGKADQSMLQDLLVMEYVDSLYEPDTYVLVLGGDVLRRSIMPDRAITYNYLVPSDSGFSIAPPAPRISSDLADLALKSAFVRYLRFNTRLDLFPLFSIPEDFQNLNVGLSEAEVQELMPEAADYILERISHQFGDKGVIIYLNFFVSRYRIYDDWKTRVRGLPDMPLDYSIIMNRVPEYRGLECVDSYQAFAEEWAVNHERFESPDEKHLSGYGNMIVARDILEHLRTTVGVGANI
ncbi:MAG: hypothetical protein GF388_06930 [Candidatus Aegiribacteria sp.]|nr:hypothetical protein [Candidatus Aegiribacteria sp.]